MNHFELTAVEFGGKRVGFTRSTRTLHLAGEDIAIEDWLERRRRIDLIISHELTPEEWKELREKMAWLGKRDRLAQELRGYEAPRGQPANNFISQNFEELNQIRRGKVQKPPWWLRWLYDAVITKERYTHD